MLIALFCDRTAVRILEIDLLRLSAEPLLIRYLYVRRGLRRQGIGRWAVELLIDHYQPMQIDVEALTTNQGAVRFWHGMGFTDRSVSMRLRAASSPGGAVLDAKGRPHIAHRPAPLRLAHTVHTVRTVRAVRTSALAPSGAASSCTALPALAAGALRCVDCL